jgi:hypothetical protein
MSPQRSRGSYLKVSENSQPYPPLWREAIVGAVLVNATLIVNPTTKTDRNRTTITAALTLLQVEMVVQACSQAAGERHPPMWFR